ncbi:MAG: phosphomannomutase/phosphoglucomutase [Euryarchaeota archaeon]|nr:phosphomannomutase/phosphoglucomutase [Euryarchaeota archaeon]
MRRHLAWPSDFDIEQVKSVFKAYDIRGIFGEAINEQFAYRLGAALATYLDLNTLVVGRDIRESSPILHTAFLLGLKESGVHVQDIGIVPTGSMYHATHVLDVEGGVMITASHNPPKYNGFKMNNGTAAMAGDSIQELLNVFLNSEFKMGNGSITNTEILNDHINSVIERLDSPIRNLKVAIDCGNAVAGPAMIQLFKKLNVETVPLFCDWDNQFPNHAPDPTRIENMQHLAKAVIENNCDFGIGIDGDGDRVGLVDENGTFIHPDKMLALFAIDLLKKRVGLSEQERTIIFDVKCSMAVETVIKENGGIPLMLRTGHSFQKQALRENPLVPLAGEMSGHIFFNDNWPGFDDSLYVSARLVELVSRTLESNERFSDLIGILPVYSSTGEAKVHFISDDKNALMQSIIDSVNNEGLENSTIDGIRFNFEKEGKVVGWCLCRLSNTEPIFVMRAEAIDDENLIWIKSEVNRIISPHLDISEFLNQD